MNKFESFLENVLKGRLFYTVIEKIKEICLGVTLYMNFSKYCRKNVEYKL
jgi:hypothetical protein